jgi:hypothetical protein
MNEWEKLWIEEPLYRLVWRSKVKTEGDKLLEEKRSLLIHGKLLRSENHRLEQENKDLQKRMDKMLIHADWIKMAQKLDELDKVNKVQATILREERNKLETIQTAINDHPKNGKAIELIHRIEKVLDK